MLSTSTLSYQDRIAHCQNPVAKKLLQCISEKESNLALSADVTHADELVQLADQLGPDICVLKTHIDIIEDFHPSLTTTLTALAKKHHFLLFEDRKFADIGHTVKKQCAGGIYRIAEWADIINAHTVPGPGIINGLAEAYDQQPLGLLLLAQMSAKGNLAQGEYTRASVRLAEQHPEHVMGFIATEKLSNHPGLLTLTPGVHLDQSGDALGQHYLSPQGVIFDNACDVIIVGRGIVHAPNPQQAARTYRQQGWQAYLARLAAGNEAN
jgi:uridine monophosphate synthetase